MSNQSEQIMQPAKLMQIAESRPQSNVGRAIRRYYSYPGLYNFANLIAEVAKDDAASSDINISLPFLIEEFLMWADSRPWPPRRIMKIAASVQANCAKIYGKHVDDNYDLAERLANSLRRR